MATNRYEELRPLHQIIVDNLINTIAAESVDDLILYTILRAAQNKIREGAKS
jgi:hypothetical protein